MASGFAQIPAGQVMPLATRIQHDRRIGNAITVSSETLPTRVRCSDVESHFAGPVHESEVVKGVEL